MVNKYNLKIQWNPPATTDIKEPISTHGPLFPPYYPGVCIKWALTKKVKDTCFIYIKTKALYAWQWWTSGR